MQCAIRVRVPADLSYFEGHFEGDPIVPGIAQLLALVWDQAKIAWPDLPAPREVKRLKFLDALRPEVLQDGRTYTGLIHPPFGVAAAITPWNFPISMPHWMVLPSLVAGNTVVLKPSEETPLIAQAYVDLLHTVLPPGVLSVVHGADDQGKALVAAAIDRQRADEEMLTHRARFDAVANQAQDMLVEIDSKGRITYMSPASRTVLGREPASFIGLSIRELTHPEDLAMAEKSFDQISTGQHHAAAVLKKPFLHRIIVKIHPAVGAAHDHDDHARIAVQHLVADGRPQQVLVRLDPIFEIEGP